MLWLTSNRFTALKLFVLVTLLHFIALITATYVWSRVKLLKTDLLGGCIDPLIPILCIFTTFKPLSQKLSVRFFFTNCVKINFNYRNEEIARSNTGFSAEDQTR